MALPDVALASDLSAALQSEDHDVVIVTGTPATFGHDPTLSAIFAAHRQLDRSAESAVTLCAAPTLKCGRIIFAPVTSLDRDEDDVRRFAEAAANGITRARDAGATRPLLVVFGDDDARYQHAGAVAAIGALGAVWEPLEGREARGEGELEPIRSLSVHAAGLSADALDWAHAVEAGRRAARDVGGTEPERMRPEAMAEYCRSCFSNTAVSVVVLDDEAELRRDYPLLSAVARASFAVPRHRPHVIRLHYKGDGTIRRTLMFAGKGVTYDTGGADLKTGGHMAGMSRDKGGAAAVIGFMATVAKLAPDDVEVIAEIGAVRNSVGADAFVSDEIITGHAGVRVRIGNTDAEGRLVLADLLSHLRTKAAAGDLSNPRLFTVATLTGHAALAVGPYTVAIDNGPARAAGVAPTLERAGDDWGDPFQISRLRREDFDFIKPRTSADDVLSCNNGPSSGTPRGHQFPAAFMLVAAGLAPHASRDAVPLPYTHIDIAGSATVGGDWQHGRPTGAPVVAFTAALLNDGV